MDGRIRNQAACVPFYQNAYKMSWDSGWKPFLCTPWRQLNASLGFCSAAMSSGSALWILDSYDRQSTQRCKRSAKTYGRCKGAERTVCVARETSQAFHGLKQALDDARSVKESREMGALLATGSTDKGISMQMTAAYVLYWDTNIANHCDESWSRTLKLHRQYALGQRHEQSASGEMKVVPRLKIYSPNLSKSHWTTFVSPPANLSLDGIVCQVCLSTFAPACREEVQLRGFVQVHFSQLVQLHPVVSQAPPHCNSGAVWICIIAWVLLDEFSDQLMFEFCDFSKRRGNTQSSKRISGPESPESQVHSSGGAHQWFGCTSGESSSPTNWAGLIWCDGHSAWIQLADANVK